MNHFMKYDESADINPSDKVINELGMMNTPMSGAMARSQSRFDQGISRAVLTPMKGARLAFENLKSILANDPKAEEKKVRIVKLLYKWVVQGDTSVSPEDNAEEQQQ